MIGTRPTCNCCDKKLPKYTKRYYCWGENIPDRQHVVNNLPPDVSLVRLSMDTDPRSGKSQVYCYSTWDGGSFGWALWDKVEGIVRPTPTCSRKCFEKLGFVLMHNNPGFVLHDQN